MIRHLFNRMLDLSVSRKSSIEPDSSWKMDRNAPVAAVYDRRGGGDHDYGFSTAPRLPAGGHRPPLQRGILPVKAALYSCRMLLGVLTLFGLSTSALRADEPATAPNMLLVVGAGGTDEYGGQFQDWSKQWEQTANAGGVRVTVLGNAEASANYREKLQQTVQTEPHQGSEPLWLVLLGHGTWDGKTAKFNLRGDDVSAPELAEWLKPFERPVIVIAAFSSSGAWLGPLAAPNRIVLTATRSGSEENFARLGQYLPSSFADLSADLDKDGQVSLLEAWLTSAKQVAEFYTGEGRLATEHSLLDDNADGKGTPPDWFQGVRAVKKSKDNAAPDGVRAHQIHLVKNSAEKALPAPLRTERDALELEIAKLRDAKSTMEEDAYYQELEALLLKLAQLYAD